MDSILTAHGLSILPAWESISTAGERSGGGIGVSILPERLVRRRLPGTIHAVEIEGISFRGISS